MTVVLTEIADGVFVRQSAFCQSNAGVVRGADGVLLVDAGVDGPDLAGLADDVDALGVPVVAGLSTHPHWDHVLWHERFGSAPRYATATAADVCAERLDRLREQTAELAPAAPLDLVGQVVALPGGTVPWDGPVVTVHEHHAHAPGHAAVVVEGTGVLLAGDMLSDVEIPLLDPRAQDQVAAYLAALDLLAGLRAGGADVLVPGHGAVALGAEIDARIAADRAYVESIRRGVDPLDPRVGPDATYGTDWLPREHEQNLRIASSAGADPPSTS